MCFAMWLEFFFIFVVKNALCAPNFVVILTDDQDLLLDGLVPMNKTLELLANNGATFQNAFVNSPICCPSRSTILTGKYLHNHNVKNNSLSGNCSSLEWQLNHEPFTIPALLKTFANYTIFYGGKYLNQYGSEKSGGIKHIPNGFDWWNGLKGNSKYYNYTLSINGTAVEYKNEYLTDVLKSLSLRFLQRSDVTTTPFFMMVAPPAPHAPFTAATRHRNTFPNVTALRTPSFNYTPINKHWVVKMPPVALPSDIKILDDIQKHRMQALLAVDELIESVVLQLEKLNLLDNTYIIYTSDNGFHIGQFTQPWDKRQPYETDIRVPFIVRGPGIAKKSLVKFPISMVDLAPTILDLANVEIPKNMDGTSFKDKLINKTDVFEEGVVLIEYFGEGNKNAVDVDCPWTYSSDVSECTLDNWCKCQDSKNNTYACVVDVKRDYSFKFCQFYDDLDFVEAYNLTSDPYELDNIYKKMSVQEQQHYRHLLNKMVEYRGLDCAT